MNCPVCEQDGLENGAVACLNCNSDISSFNLIGSLSKERKMLKITCGILGVMVVGLVVAWAVIGETSTNTEVVEDKEPSAEILELKNQLSEKENKIISLNNDITKLRENATEDQEAESSDVEADDPQIDGHKFHVVKEGETLFNITKDYLDDGFKYEDITVYNKLEDKDFILAGDTIIIKF